MVEPEDISGEGKEGGAQDCVIVIEGGSITRSVPKARVDVVMREGRGA